MANCALPIQSRVYRKKANFPSDGGDEVEVVGMPPAEECEPEMFVNIRWQRRTLSVPLSQLEGLDVDDQTQEGIEDWHYWVNRGYQF
jgi:hypothetical protein